MYDCIVVTIFKSFIYKVNKWFDRAHIVPLRRV